MSLPQLTVIPAGAGSGKTHTIQEKLGEWIVDGKISPERIVAVTFTEAAAAELRERIRGKLLRLGRIDDALKLDQAYISTIHSFGLRLLTEFAFDSGRSPIPRLLNNYEENSLIRLALARTDRADVIASNLAKFGYSYSWTTGKGPEDVFRDDLLGVVGLLRFIGWTAESANFTSQASNWITNRFGKTGDGDAFARQLSTHITHLLSAFPGSLAPEFGTNKTAKSALQKDFQNLHRGLNQDLLRSDWGLWKSLRTLRQSKQGTSLPDEYDELAGVVMAAADALPRHPGMLTHSITHVEALLAAGQDILVHYARAKHEAGLVDYTDMIAVAEDILGQNADVLTTLKDRVDCLVIDEFQDTNPLQFALLWKLKEAGVPTLVVGDLKQAIMGFQGADPRLFEALEQQNQKARKPLRQNWRSQPRLMDFINGIGLGLFGDKYDSLKPEAAGSGLDPLEFISFPVKAKKDQHEVRAAFVGQRLKALLDDPKQIITDPRTKQKRRLRGGDMAVLCSTHRVLAAYATIFRRLGLAVRLQESGWVESRVVQISLQALAYIANPNDRHAALYLAVTELGSLSLEDGLRQLVETGQIDDPILDALDKLAPEVADGTVYALLVDTLSALKLFDASSAWPDGDQARANLLRLQAEAAEFMDTNREALATGGFHGSGIQSFLAWLDKKVEEDNKQPDPKVIGEDAIELVTWHSSKGREWPVVAVCNLDHKIGARLPNLAIGYRDFDDLSSILKNAQIEYSPLFAAPEANERLLAELNVATDTESRRLLYVAMTRPRDKLILEWPEFLEGNETATFWSILRTDVGLEPGNNIVRIGDREFPSIISLGGSELPPNIDVMDSDLDAKLSDYGRRAIKLQEWSEDLTPDQITPSAIEVNIQVFGDLDLEVHRYGEGLTINIGLSGTRLGNFLHRCFEVLGANSELADRIPATTGYDIDTNDLQKVSAAVSTFERWLGEQFSIKSIDRELPMLSLDTKGSVVSGIVDLVMNTEEGAWVIDHKSDAIDDPKEAYKKYRPQLMSYKSAIDSAESRVIGIGINWISRGEVVLERF